MDLGELRLPSRIALGDAARPREIQIQLQVEDVRAPCLRHGWGQRSNGLVVTTECPQLSRVDESELSLVRVPPREHHEVGNRVRVGLRYSGELRILPSRREDESEQAHEDDREPDERGETGDALRTFVGKRRRRVSDSQAWPRLCRTLDW